MAAEDPDKPFSALRVAIWAIGVITLVAVLTSSAFILLYPGTSVPTPFPALVLAGINMLGMTAGYAVGRGVSPPEEG